MQTQEQKIAELEKKLIDLQDRFDSMFKNSDDTRLFLKRTVAFDANSLVGFYGKDPIKQQTATDLATLLVAMKAYGLLAP